MTLITFHLMKDRCSMKIRIINPVPDLAPEAVEGMGAYLQAGLDAGTEIEFVPVAGGFRSIETEAQGIINGAEILRVVMTSQEDSCDGIFINCFDDPALIGARELSKKPVLGPYGASVLFASMIGEKLGIITTDDYGRCCEERKARHYQFTDRIAAVEKVDMTVLDLQEGDLLQRLVHCCQRLEQQQIYAVILGCTGMNFAADALKQALAEAGCRIQVIEPLKTGVKMLELMIKMGYHNAIESTPVKTEDYRGVGTDCARQDTMIEHLRQLLAIPSVSGTEAVRDALECVLSICDQLGFRTKNCDGKLGYAEIGQGDELMGILCHLDVVPAGEGWQHPPFAGEITEGRIYGRGVMDDKGPAMAAIYAMKDVLDAGLKLDKRVRIIFGCQEETGEWEDMKYYKATEEIPSFGFTPDADFPAIYGEKGILMVSLSMDGSKSGFAALDSGEAPNMVADWAKAVLTDGTVLEAAGKAAHGSTPEEGENAITKLMEQAAERGAPFARFYMDKIGWCLDGSKIGIGLSDEASGSLTFNVGQVELSDGEVRLKVDIRYPVTFAESTVLNGLRQAVSSDGVSAEVITSMQAVYMDRDGEVITKLMESYRQATGDERPPLVMGGGTYARAMDNIVAFGPVFPGRDCTEHKKDEWIYAEDLEKAREIYRLAIEKLACK